MKGCIIAMMMTIASPSFKHGQSIPSQYTCDGHRNTNPPLEFSGVLPKTVSLALLVDDPDVPKEIKPDGVFDHWTLFNMPPDTAFIPETNDPAKYPGVIGINSAGQKQYTGPCPPKEPEPEEHHYYFKLYALDCMLELPVGATKAHVLAAMEGHILEKSELVGRYKKQK